MMLTWIVVGVVGAVALFFLVRWIQDLRMRVHATQYFDELLTGAVRAANEGRPPGAQIKSVDDIAEADLPNVTSGLLRQRGVDPAAPENDRSRAQREDVERKVDHWLRFGGQPDQRANYERVVRRAREILADDGGGYTEGQRAAADSILHTPIHQLGQVRESELNAFFEQAEKRIRLLGGGGV